MYNKLVLRANWAIKIAACAAHSTLVCMEINGLKDDLSFLVMQRYAQGADGREVWYCQNTTVCMQLTALRHAMNLEQKLSPSGLL